LSLPDLKTIGSISGPVLGLIGIGISVWTRIDQKREGKRRESIARPYFAARYGAPGFEGWCKLDIALVNPSNQSFRMFRVTLVKRAKGKLIGNSAPSAADFSGGGVRSAPVEWRVNARDEPTGQSLVSTTSIFYRPSKTRGVIALRIDAQEISALRERFTMRAHARPAEMKQELRFPNR
jgi:hypothetical protein